MTNFRLYSINIRKLYPKKIYRLKEDQAFSLSLELGLKRKSCAAFVCRFPPSICWRGWWFGRYCYCGENGLERMRDNWFCGSFGTVPLNFLLHVQNCTSENCKFTLSFLYRGNVHLWPKSDDSKKSLVLFYLFTLWLYPIGPACYMLSLVSCSHSD
jgi:hypothetical protein